MVQQAASLDSLTVLLFEAEQNLQKIDALVVEQTYSAIQADINFIQKNLKDSVSKSQAQAFSTYAESRKNLKTFKEKRTQLVKEFEITEKQLKNLSADLKKGAIEKNKAAEYFVMEKEQASKLLFDIIDLQDRIDKSMSLSNTNKPAVDSLKREIELKMKQ